MTYQETINYLLGFTNLELKPGQSLIKKDFDLQSISKLLQLMGNPHHLFKSIHVAGSKGKGSTAAMIEKGLRSSGKKTGLYTSPHLVDYAERFRIDGLSVNKQEIIEGIEYLKPFIERVPSIQTFEIMTALAFHIFAKNHVDWAVVEVGLGGRLDATNVLLPEMSVITPIFKEHTHVLGDTIEEIAFEKGGIIKPKTPVVISFQPNNSAKETLLKISQKRNSSMIFAPENIHIKKIRGSSKVNVSINDQTTRVQPSLLGDHQLINIQTAACALDKLGINKEYIIEAIENTIWPGRFEVKSINNQTYIFDAAHIPEAVAHLVNTYKNKLDEKVTVIFGASGDKDIPQMIDQLKEIADKIILTKANHPRSADPQKIYESLLDDGVDIIVTDSLREALSSDEVRQSKQVLITGSFFVVGDAMKELGIEVG